MQRSANIATVSGSLPPILAEIAGEAAPAGLQPNGRRATPPLILYGRPPMTTDSAGRYGVAEDPESERVRIDEALMARVAAGDDAAFAVLVDDLAPRLLRFARSMLAESPAEAEEVVQEALLRLWQQAAKWQPHGRVSTWLHQVTYRLSIDSLRRRRPSVAIEMVADLEDAGPAPDHRLLRADDVRAVRAAIERLPERQRAALVLGHFQEMSQSDAAAVMGIGESAYESLLARARRRLRTLLLDGGGESNGGVS